MVTIFISISNSIIDSGFCNALIRKTDAKSIDYNTVFYFNLVLGIFFYLLLYFFSPLISQFFKEPVLIPVLKVFGLVLIVNSLALIQRVLFIKKIDFKTQAKISLIASITSGIIGITMAYFKCGVWSLVGQQLSRQFLITLFFWIYSSWYPAWEFSKKSFKELFGFGSKLLAAGLIDTIYKDIYYLIIGRFYSAAQLGQYTRASQFNDIFAKNLTTVIQKVSYPVLSSIQEDPERLKTAYRKVIKTTVIASFMGMLGLAAVAKPLILLLIGEKWLTAVYYLQIICFGGMLYPLHAINLNMLQVKGRSDLYLKLEIIKKILAVIPIFLGIFLGIEVMLWGGVFNSFVAYFLNSYYSADLINYSTKEQIKDVFPTLFISLFIAGCMWFLNFVGIRSNILLITLQAVVGFSIFMLIYEKLQQREYVEVKQMILSGIRKIK
ncbi:lipopolysaccharide biosynthesis protein [Bacteroidia bacterium]|nr:lipopolysaccharide biosynthesis protein [Bacteroidia bacterium]